MVQARSSHLFQASTPPARVGVGSALIVCALLWCQLVPSVLAQDSDVMVTMQTIPVETLRLSDFDPIMPQDAPVILNLLLTNDGLIRTVRVEVSVVASQFGFIASGSTVVDLQPNEVRQLTNRDIDTYEFDDAQDFIDLATEIGRFPSDMYTFTVSVVDVTDPRQPQVVATDDDIIETVDASFELDPIQPGVPFGQEPEELNNPNPVFEWSGTASQYSFVLYEVRPGQASAQDVTNNIPVYEADGLATTTFIYPIAAEELEPGQQYAWQVLAQVTTASGVSLQPSELYAFRMAPPILATESVGEGGGVAAAPSLEEQSPPLRSTIGERRPARLEIVPDEITLTPGSLFLFRVSALDSEDQPVAIPKPRWTLTPSGMGRIDADGQFVAGDTPGAVAVTATVGTLRNYATVFIDSLEPPAVPMPATDVPGLPTETDDFARSDSTLADSMAVVEAVDSLNVQVQIVSPLAEQDIFAPTPTFLWEVTGADSLRGLRYRVQVWPTLIEAPIDIIPDVPPLFSEVVQGTQALSYPLSAIPPTAGQTYTSQVDVILGNQIIAQSAPVRFTMASDDKISWDLRRAWDDAQRTQTDDVPVTLIALLTTDSLTPLNRQALQDAGSQIAIEDGPWVQLALPFVQLSQVSQLDFIRTLNLPAPQLTASVLPSDLTEPAPADPRTSSSTDLAEVPVAIFEFGFDLEGVERLLGSRPFETFSFRQDDNIAGGEPAHAAHGLATLRAMLDYLPSTAELHLYNFETELEFRQALRHAIEERQVRVISCSVAWLDAYDNYDGTSYFSQQLASILGTRTTFVTAAGNFGQSHWEGAFTDTNGDGLHEFAVDSEALNLRLRQGAEYRFLLSWSDDWDDPRIDFDLEVLDSMGRPIYDRSGRPYTSSSRQGPQQPEERIRSFMPPRPGVQTYQVRVSTVDRPPNTSPFLELYMYPPPVGSTPVAVTASSLAGGFATTVSASVVPVGAEGYAHSSQGPTNDQRIRPDFMADGTVQVGTELIQGTSFAAPRVASAYALVFARYPSWTVQQATEYLRQFTPQDRTKSPVDGWGELDFEALLRSLSP